MPLGYKLCPSLEKSGKKSNENGRIGRFIIASHLLQHLSATYAAPPLPDSALHFLPQNLPMLPANHNKVRGKNNDNYDVQ